MLATFILYMYMCTGIFAGINLELVNPKIPWFRSSEYTVKVESQDKKMCPDWKNVYEDIEITEKAINSGEENTCIRKYIIDPLKSGNYLISSVEMQEQDGSKWRTSAFVLEVREPTEEELKELEQVASIVEPRIKRSLKRLIISVVVVGILLSIIGGLALYIKKRFMTKEIPPEIIELPWDKAFRRLKELKSKDFPSQGLFEQYYVQLTWILRYYIEDRFSIHAPEQTTPEFIETTMNEKVLTEEQQKLLASFLKHCDRVKFAKLVPTIEQMEAGFNLVWNFVEETKTLLSDNNSKNTENTGENLIKEP